MILAQWLEIVAGSWLAGAVRLLHTCAVEASQAEAVLGSSSLDEFRVVFNPN